jgi:hypothetical protein
MSQTAETLIVSLCSPSGRGEQDEDEVKTHKYLTKKDLHS